MIIISNIIKEMQNVPGVKEYYVLHINGVKKQTILGMAIVLNHSYLKEILKVHKQNNKIEKTFMRRKRKENRGIRNWKNSTK